MSVCKAVSLGTIQVASRTALILETNNLRGGANPALTLASLRQVLIKLKDQTLAPRLLGQWIVTHDGLSTLSCEELAQLAAYPIDFVAIEPIDNYYEAKNRGFDCIDPLRCDYVAFCDADCNPASDWLEQMLLPFAVAQPDAPSVVAGRTTYSADVLGVALTSIDFMYFPTPLASHATANFYANNVAFRREVFERFRYQPLDRVYRAHCQVLGMRLRAAGISIAFAHGAHTVHRLPDSYGELLKLRWMRGEDSVSLAPYLVRAYAPRRLHWLARSGPLGPLCIMAMRLWFSSGALNRQGLAPLRGWRLLAALVVMVGVSAIDSMGALVRGVRSAARPVDRQNETLSYHRQ